MKARIIVATALALALAFFLYEWREQGQIGVLRLAIQNARKENQILTLQEQRDAVARQGQRATPEVAHAGAKPLLQEIAVRQSRAASSDHGLRPTDKSPTGIKSFAAAANAGQSTPLKALETAIWATYHGDIGALAKMMTFSPASREAAAAIFAGLPAQAQAQLQNPEYMTSLLVEYANPGSGTYEVTWSAAAAGNPDQWMLGTRMVDETGRTTGGQVSMQLVEGNWMLLVPAPVVQHLGGLLGGATKPR